MARLLGWFGLVRVSKYREYQYDIQSRIRRAYQVQGFILDDTTKALEQKICDYNCLEEKFTALGEQYKYVWEEMHKLRSKAYVRDARGVFRKLEIIESAITPGDVGHA